MRWRVLPLLLPLLGTGCGYQAPAELTEERAEAIRDSVRDLLAEYSSLVARGDWEAVGALYSDDPGFVWVEDGRLAYRSATEVRASIARMSGMFSSARTEFTSARIAPLAPGLATVATDFRHTFATEDGEEIRLEGVITGVVVHEAGGWRFLRGHTSTRSPP